MVWLPLNPNPTHSKQTGGTGTRCHMAKMGLTSSSLESTLSATQHMNNISHHQHSAIQSPSRAPLEHPRVPRAAAAKARLGRETQTSSKSLIPSTTQGCWDQGMPPVPQRLCHRLGPDPAPSSATACTHMHPETHANKPEG